MRIVILHTRDTFTLRDAVPGNHGPSQVSREVFYSFAVRQELEYTIKSLALQSVAVERHASLENGKHVRYVERLPNEDVG